MKVPVGPQEKNVAVRQVLAAWWSIEAEPLKSLSDWQLLPGQVPHFPRGGSSGGSCSTVPACRELTEATRTEHEPPGTPRACLGCCTVLQKAKLSWNLCFSSCADTQMNQGFIALQDTFFPAVRQKPSAQVL